MAFNLSEYEPVETRIARFYDQHPNGRIITELVFHDETRFIVKSFLYTTTEVCEPLATGYAEERVDNNPKRVNFASALENCETSSIGRALANANFAPRGSRPSREEMQKVQRATSIDYGAVVNTPLSNLKSRLAAYSDKPEVRKAIVTSAVSRELGSLNELTLEEIKAVGNALETRIAGEAPFVEVN